MTIELSLLISGVSVAAAVFFGIANYRRNSKTDTEKSASQLTEVIVKLETISTGITEIKAEMNSVKSEVRELRDNQITTDQSLKAAWRRIDEILDVLKQK